MTAAPASEGTLADTQLPVLFHALLVGRRTCVLDLQHQGTEKQIFFEDGVPVACTSNLVQETLGRYLVEKGVLDEVRSVELLARSVRDGKKLGQVIVEAGLLDEPTLHKHLQASLGRKILDSFRWVTARYRLLGLATVPDSALKMNPLQLIYTGVVTMLPIEMVRQGFAPPAGQRFARLKETSELKLNLRDQLIFSALDSRPTVEELAVIAGMSEEEVARRLYAWTLIRMVDFAERIEAVAAPVAVVAAEAVAPPPAPLPRSGRAVRVAAVVVVVAGGLFVALAVLQRPAEKPAAPLVAQPVPAVVAQAPREFRAPPPLPELPALPPSTGNAAQPPRQFTLSASGIRLEPPNDLQLTGLGKAFFAKAMRSLKAKKLEQAADAFSRAASVSPRDAECWYGLALMSFELADDDKALAATQEALRRVPSHPMALLLAGWLEQRAGKTSEARAHYEAYLATAAPGQAAEVQEILAQLSGP